MLSDYCISTFKITFEKPNNMNLTSESKFDLRNSNYQKLALESKFVL